MRIVKYSEVRENLRRELDLVIDNCEVTCVVSKKNQVVMIGKDEYDSMIESLHVNKKLMSLA